MNGFHVVSCWPASKTDTSSSPFIFFYRQGSTQRCVYVPSDGNSLNNSIYFQQTLVQIQLLPTESSSFASRNLRLLKTDIVPEKNPLIFCLTASFTSFFPRQGTQRDGHVYHQLECLGFDVLLFQLATCHFALLPPGLGARRGFVYTFPLNALRTLGRLHLYRLGHHAQSLHHDRPSTALSKVSLLILL